MDDVHRTALRRLFVCGFVFFAYLSLCGVFIEHFAFDEFRFSIFAHLPVFWGDGGACSASDAVFLVMYYFDCHLRHQVQAIFNAYGNKGLRVSSLLRPSGAASLVGCMPFFGFLADLFSRWVLHLCRFVVSAV